MMDLIIIAWVLLCMLIEKLSKVVLIGLAIYGGYNIIKNELKKNRNRIEIINKD